MGWSFKRFKENVKFTARKVANVVQYAAPAAGQFFGPVGIVGGQALGLAASQVGPTKDVASSLTRQLGYGAGVFAAGAGLGVLSGQGALASPASSVSSLFSKLFGSSAALPATGLTPVATAAPGGAIAGTGLPAPIYSPLSAGAQAVPGTGPGIIERLLGSSGAPIDQAAKSVLDPGAGQTDWLPYILGGGALLAVVALSGGKGK